MYLLILFVFLLSVGFWYKLMSASSLFELPFLIYVSYGFLLITTFFSGITYHSGSAFNILPYFIFTLILLIFGFIIGKTFLVKLRIKYISINLDTISHLAIFGSILFCYDLLRLNTVFLGMRIDDLKMSIFGVIGNAFASLGIIGWLYNFFYSRVSKSKLSIFAYLSILSYLLPGFLTAGRQAFILIFLSTILIFGYTRKLNRSSISDKPTPSYYGFYLVIVLVMIYFSFISSVRSGISEITGKLNVYEKEMNATTSVNTLKLAESLGPLEDIFMEGLYYYSHELVRLDLLYRYYDYPPLLGLWQMSYIERRLNWLVGPQGDISWGLQVAALETYGRFSSHTWGTFIGNFLIDFGRIGTLIVTLVLGFVLGLSFRSFRSNSTAKNIVSQALICAGVLFSIQFSPISELIYVFPLVTSVLFKISPKCLN
jgi:hypothetical protein